MGGATWFLVRSGWRRRATGGLLLVLLLGLSGATVLAAWAGARRTDTAFERLQSATNHADLIVAAEGDPSLFDPTIALHGPGVRQAGIAEGYPMVQLNGDGTPNLSSDTALIAPVGDVTFQTVSLPLLREGRVPSPDEPNEITVPVDMADAGHPVGSHIDVCFVDFDEALAYGQGVLEGTATREQQLAFVEEVCEVRRLEVVGVSLPGPDEVVLRETNETTESSFPIASPAFVDDVTSPNLFSFVVVDLEPSADPEAYLDAVLDRVPPEAGVSTQASANRAALVEHTLEPYVRALALFAALAAVAAAAVLAPAVVHWAGLPAGDLPTLRALGIRPSQLRAAAAVRGAVLGTSAALVAGAIAWVVSDRFPIGVGAEIEPFPGRRADWFVLAAGAVALIIVGAVLGAVAPATESASVRRPSRVAETVQSLGVGPARVAGVRAAVGGTGRASGLVRTVGGVAVAVAAVIAALTYQASLARLLDTPARYGWTWDRMLDGADEGISAELVAAVARDPDIETVSLVSRMTIQQAGQEVQTFAFDSITGHAGPTILEGRAPTGDAEIALGGQTLDRLDADLGSRLSFRGPRGDRAELTVVGRTLVPLTTLGSELSVAEGGVVDLAVMERFGGAEPELLLLSAAPGVAAEEVDTIVAAQGGPGPLGGSPLSGPQHSADLRGYDAVRDTPLILAGLLALLGVGVLGHTVSTSVRGRQRELAMLRVLGFRSRELRASVRWDVLTIVGACVLVAVPLGVAAGRVLWTRFAASIGVVDDPRTPVAAVVAVVLITVVLALVFAVIPGRQATRLRAAQVLRTE
jgi:hypothetical protein